MVPDVTGDPGTLRPTATWRRPGPRVAPGASFRGLGRSTLATPSADSISATHAPLGAIALADRPLLPQEVLDAAQQDVPSLGIATVYRNLKALVEEGELQPVNLPGENPRFEIVGHQHHHHFQCRLCQRVFDVHACPGDLGRLAPQGFTVEDHDLTLYGRCKDCAVPAAKSARRKATESGAHNPAAMHDKPHTKPHTHTHRHRG